GIGVYATISSVPESEATLGAARSHQILSQRDIHSSEFRFASVALVNRYVHILPLDIRPRTYTGLGRWKSNGAQAIEEIVEIQL
ncbi:hypothetical protein MTO96_038890, partial [Rhipicephalus appendiculatus]